MNGKLASPLTQYNQARIQSRPHKDTLTEEVYFHSPDVSWKTMVDCTAKDSTGEYFLLKMQGSGDSVVMSG